MFLVDRPGFEPGTSRVQAERSSRLSYRPTHGGLFAGWVVCKDYCLGLASRGFSGVHSLVNPVFGVSVA